MDDHTLDLTILLPCRDEAAAAGICVDEAADFLTARGLRGEALVVDNGSRDNSAAIARAHGARVIREPAPGYGRALRTGLQASRGRVIVMCDCDATYDFSQVGGLYDLLSEGRFDVVIGDRFKGGIQRGAMPLSHRLGGKALSALGRRRFHTDVRDFHCGLRGLTRGAAEAMVLRTDGMEFATELIAEAARKGLRVGQIPVRLRRCDLPRASKLRVVRDGWRHLCFIFSGHAPERGES